MDELPYTDQITATGRVLWLTAPKELFDRGRNEAALAEYVRTIMGITGAEIANVIPCF